MQGHILAAVVAVGHRGSRGKVHLRETTIGVGVLADATLLEGVDYRRWGRTGIYILSNRYEQAIRLEYQYPVQS